MPHSINQLTGSEESYPGDIISLSEKEKEMSQSHLDPCLPFQ